MPAGIVATAAFNDLKSGSQLLAHIMFADDTNLFYSLSSFNLPKLKTNDHGIFFLSGVFSETLTIHRTAREGKEPFLLLCTIFTRS